MQTLKIIGNHHVQLNYVAIKVTAYTNTETMDGMVVYREINIRIRTVNDQRTESHCKVKIWDLIVGERQSTFSF